MQAGVRARISLLGRALLLLLVVYSGLRALFLILHGELFQGIPGASVAGAFLRGVRFDLSAIAFSNIPFLLLALAPALLFRRPGYRRLLKWVFVTLNSFFVAVMVADLEYFTFTGTRATFDLLQLTTEAAGQLDQLVVNYAPLVLLAVGLGWLLHRGYPATGGGRSGAGHDDGAGGGLQPDGSAASTGSAPGNRSPIGLIRTGLVGAAYRLAILALVVVAARGGLQKKVLQPMHAFESGNQELGLLTLNSTFTLLQSPLQPELEPLAFFDSDEEAWAILEAPFGLRGGLNGGRGTPVGSALLYPTGSRPVGLRSAGRRGPSEGTGQAGGAAGAGPNVVLLILESFATEFWGAAHQGKGYTPFLDTLVPRGIFLPNNFANGRNAPLTPSQASSWACQLAATSVGPDILQLSGERSSDFHVRHGSSELVRLTQPTTTPVDCGCFGHTYYVFPTRCRQRGE